MDANEAVRQWEREQENLESLAAYTDLARPRPEASGTPPHPVGTVFLIYCAALFCGFIWVGLVVPHWSGWIVAAAGAVFIPPVIGAIVQDVAEYRRIWRDWNAGL